MIKFRALWLLGGSWVRWVQFSAQIRCTRLRWPSGPAGRPNLDVKSNKRRPKPNFSHIPHKFLCNMQGQYDFQGALGSADLISQLKLDVPGCIDRLDQLDVPILRLNPIKKSQNLTFLINYINFHAIWLLGGSWIRRGNISAQIRCTRLRWPSEPAGGPDFE